MEIFIKNFIELFDDIDPKSITPSTKFRELDDWDSIMALSLLGMIDDEYGVTLNSADMKECQTIEDLFNKIESKE